MMTASHHKMAVNMCGKFTFSLFVHTLHFTLGRCFFKIPVKRLIYCALIGHFIMVCLDIHTERNQQFSDVVGCNNPCD